MKRLNRLIIGMTICAFINPTYALNKTYDISKFVEIDVDAGYQQKNLTDIVVSYQFNSDIFIVGQALNYALNGSGYTLVSLKKLDENVLQLLTKPLPEVHRYFTYVTLDNLLKTIVGPAYSVQYDHTRREVLIVSNALLPQVGKYSSNN